MERRVGRSEVRQYIATVTKNTIKFPGGVFIGMEEEEEEGEDEEEEEAVEEEEMEEKEEEEEKDTLYYYIKILSNTLLLNHFRLWP